MQNKRNLSKKDAVVLAFMNHCAVIIQSHFRGYQQRKYYRKFLPLYKRFKQLLYAGFIGWKTRKTLKLGIVRNKINEIKSLKSQQKNLQLRIGKRDLTDQISRLLKNDLWLYYFLKQKKLPLAQKAIMNKNEVLVIKKIDLKQAFNIIPKENTRKIIKKSQNFNLPQEKILSEQLQELYVAEKLKNEKNFENQRKTKKFEDPPKPNNNIKTQKAKQLNIKIETKIESELVTQTISCETPNQVANKLTQLTFHTKPRVEIAGNKKLQFGIADTEEPFKQIHVITHGHRKGLNMTLSKKQLEQKMAQSAPINLQVLNDFTRKKIPLQEHSNSQKAFFDFKEVSVFTTKQQERNLNKHSNEKNESLQKGKNISLLMQKEAFEKRKKQFEKKSKQFKADTLK